MPASDFETKVVEMLIRCKLARLVGSDQVDVTDPKTIDMWTSCLSHAGVITSDIEKACLLLPLRQFFPRPFDVVECVQEAIERRKEDANNERIRILQNRVRGIEE